MKPSAAALGRTGSLVTLGLLPLCASLLSHATPPSDTRAPAAEAAPPPANLDLTRLSLEELTSLKVDTVYGASKHTQRTTEAPSSVSIVTQEDIRKYGYRTLSDVLNRVRGFYVGYDRLYHTVGVRGFNRPGDFGGRILMMVDGHRLNDGIYDSAASGTDFPLDIDLVERVEIIRGPGSSLYGNNAFFGVINVVTRRGSSVDGTELSGSYGHYDTWTGRATYGERFAGGLEFLVSATLLDSAGAGRLSFPEFEAQDLDGSWAGNAFASVTYRDFTLQGGFGHREKDVPTAAYGTIPNSQDPRLWSLDERAFADLRFERQLDDDWQLSARGYFDQYRYAGRNPYDLDDDPSTRPDVNLDRAIATSAGWEFSVRREFGQDHQVTAGTEWRHDFELHQRNWDEFPEFDYHRSNESGDWIGVFAQDEWRPFDELIFNGGLRYDYFSTFGDTVNPRAALIYTPWEPTTFKALFGTAFRAPNANEFYYSGAGYRENPDLQPEEIRSYEWVWEQRFGSQWRTATSLFWNDVTDLIAMTWDPAGNLASTDDDILFFDNTNSARSRGVEFEVEHQLPSGCRTLASYAFTDTTDFATGQSLVNAPEHLFKLNVDMPVWRKTVFAAFELQAMSRRLTLAGNSTDAHAVAHFTLFGRELVPGLELSATIYNLFDHRFDHPVSADLFYTGPVTGDTVQLDQVEQDGRGFRLKLTYRF